jgi:two-component system response regulator ChvI
LLPGRSTHGKIAGASIEAARSPRAPIARVRSGEPKAGSARLLLVDDDARFREALRRKLVKSGFDVVSFATPARAYRYLRTGGTADLLLLDWAVRGTSAVDVMRHLRAARIDLPVIVLTTLSEKLYEETALVAGAVDFIDKSKSSPILIRRIRLTLARTLRRTTQAKDAARQVGSLILVPSSNSVVWQRHRVRLSPTECRIVRLLVERAGKNVRYREILREIRRHGRDARSADVNEPSLRTFIKSIRKKFRKVDSRFNRIENDRSVGYHWLPENSIANA